MKFSSLKKHNHKLIEVSLWFLFLGIIFYVGFFHGSQPESKLSYHYEDEKNLSILTTERDLIPEEIINRLEIETHSKIGIIEKKTYEAIRTEIIINKRIALLVIPENFITSLNKDNRLKNLGSFKTSIEELIHNDFIPKKYDSQYYHLPLFWTINVFENTKSNKEINNKNIHSLINDSFLLEIKKKFPKFGISKETSYHTLFELPKNSASIKETTLQLATINKFKNISDYFIDPEWSYLMIFSLAIPYNTPDSAISNKYIELILKNPIIRKNISELVIGSTFIMKASPPIHFYINPDSLRNLSLGKFNILRK